MLRRMAGVVFVPCLLLAAWSGRARADGVTSHAVVNLRELAAHPPAPTPFDRRRQLNLRRLERELEAREEREQHEQREQRRARGASEGERPAAPAAASLGTLPLASPPAGVTFQGHGANFGNPPDTMGAVGPNHVVTCINVVLVVHDKTGHVLSSVNFEQFFAGIPDAGYAFDPRCAYDSVGGRFILSATGNLSDLTKNKVLVAVSETSDPTGNWHIYGVEADPANHQLFADGPNLGFNKKWIAIRANLDPVNSGNATGGIWAFDKADLYAGGSGKNRFIHADVTNAVAVETYDAALEDEYVVAVDGQSGLKVYRLTGAVGSETFEHVADVSAPMRWSGNTPESPQRGSNVKIHGNTDVIISVLYRNGSLWLSQSVEPTSGPSRAAAQWWQFDAHGTVQQFGRIDDPTGKLSYILAGIAVNKNSDVLLGYSLITGDEFPAGGYAVHMASDPPGTMREGVVYHTGNSAAGDGRFGDYSHSVVDPANETDFWTIQETSKDGNWDTWWGQIVMPASAGDADAGPGPGPGGDGGGGGPDAAGNGNLPGDGNATGCACSVGHSHRAPGGLAWLALAAGACFVVVRRRTRQ